MSVRVVSQPDLAGILIYSPYSLGFVQLLKDGIPTSLRMWRRDLGAWYVFQDHAETAMKLAIAYWGKDEIDLTGYTGASKTSQKEGWEWNATRTKKRWVDSSGTPGPWKDDPPKSQGSSWRQTSWQENKWGQAPATTSPDHAMLYITLDAPKEVVRAAYKALAILHHPDKGGDPAKMSSINQAYDRLKERGKA